MRALGQRLGIAAALLATACVSAPERTTGVPVDQARTTPATLAQAAGALRVSDPAVAGLSTEARDALGRAPLPMLILPAEYASGTQIMSDAHWVALSYAGDGISVSLHATNVWHDGATAEDLAQLPQPTGSVRGHLAWETENETIQSISWNEHDVAFALEVECADPLGDARCQDGGFVRALAGRLVPAQEQAQ